MCGDPGDDGYAASCRPPRAWTDPNSATLTRERTRTVMRQVLRALEHAHSRGICHRNLHSGHLLLDPAADGGCGRVAIASWSSSRRLQTPPAPVSPLRTCTVPYNVAPEGLLHHETIEDDYAGENQGTALDDGYGDGETYGPEVDVWSAGCIFAESPGTLPLQQVLVRSGREDAGPAAVHIQTVWYPARRHLGRRGSLGGLERGLVPTLDAPVASRRVP